ncbi:MAG: AraC family transcriptional regulator [Candidatus Azobacteroides sp.]|nr:AraC family transcriptional regulator [Candidatus Azobacteroides sp.]
MKISIHQTGIISEFTRAIGATVKGRFVFIPESRGGGYITGFNWENALRMMIRNYYLNEEVNIEWTNEQMIEQDYIAIFLSGVFPSLTEPDSNLSPEPASMLICKQKVSTAIDMPSNTVFRSITISVSRQYLHTLFSHIHHPVVESVLEAKDNLILEMGISPEIIGIASEMLRQNIPGSMESHYYKLKCEELLCHIFVLLMQREEIPLNHLHIDDIKAIYAVKAYLLSHPEEAPHIALLAEKAGMSQPKLRKLFKQTFGKNMFDYYQSVRMQKAAHLLKEKKLSVSEVGYQLGFSNLSHFSRIFEEYIGMKPKKYSLM